MKTSYRFALVALAAVVMVACGRKPAEKHIPTQEEMQEVVTETQAAFDEAAEAIEQANKEYREAIQEAKEELKEALAEIKEEQAEQAEEQAEQAADEAEEKAEEQADQQDKEEPIFMVVESMPELPYDKLEFASKLRVNISDVDPAAEAAGVVVQLIVEKDGTTSHHEVLRSSGNPKIDAYAIEYVKKILPAFRKPGIQRGQPVRTKYLVPVKFS